MAVKKGLGPRSNVHRRVRRQHAHERAEDYVEAIHNLLQKQETITVGQLQEVFGVSHVTVIRRLQRLEEDGLLSGSRSKEIQLTERGETMAKEAAARHHLLRRFLVALGVSEEQADADAEGAEHHLSQETLSAIARFLESEVVPGR